MDSGVCLTPSLVLHNNRSLCMQSISAPPELMILPVVPQQWARSPLSASIQPEVLLLLCFALTIWLLGVVSGLLLPIALQKLSVLWGSSPAAADDADSISGDSAALAPGLQSRPLSDVDPDEVLYEPDDDVMPSSSSAGGLSSTLLSSPGALTPHWHITEADLQHFKAAVDPVKGRLLTGDLGAGWNFIMEKEQPGRMRYASYMRPTANGKTDYLSITIVNGTTAQEMQDFNLDDQARVRWDPMLKRAWLLQSGPDVGHTCDQLVVYLRSFPMGFVSDRLYAGISRREFTDPADPGCFWAVSKVVHTPATAAWAALNYPGVTTTDDYFSAWECRTILSPWAIPAADPGTDAQPQPACAIILFHRDDLKVPEYLARTAIKLGMWKFVQGMVGYADKWLEQRRARADPFEADPQAAGRQPAPPLAPDVAAAAAAVAHRHAPSPALHLVPSDGNVTAAAGIAGAPVAVTTQSTGGQGVSMARTGSFGGFGSSQQQPLLRQRQQHAEQEPEQPPTPRVLYSVPTAPGPLHLMGLEREGLSSAAGGAAGGIDGSSGLLVRGKGALRRGHSLEWEPRLQSSSNSSSVVGNPQHDSPAAAAAAVGEVGPEQGMPQAVWRRLTQAAAGVARRSGEFFGAVAGAVGGAVAGAVGGAVLQVVQAPAAQWARLQGAFRGQQQPGATDTPGSSSSSSVSGRVAKLPSLQARLIAPAGPEDEEAAAAAAAAAAAVGAAQAGSRMGGSSAISSHFGSSSSSSSSGSRRGGGRNSNILSHIRKLLVAAGVAAAVGAGLAHRKRVVGGGSRRAQEAEGEVLAAEQSVLQKLRRRPQRRALASGL